MKNWKKHFMCGLSILLAAAMIANSGTIAFAETSESVDISNGLIAYYDFETVTGTTVTNNVDAATFAGTLSGSATISNEEGTNEFDNSLKLGSAAGGMQLTDIINASTSSFSVSLWYKASTTSVNNVNLVQAGEIGGSTGRTILILNPSSKYYTFLTGDNANITTTTTVTPTEWQQVIFAYDQAAGKAYFYINGTADNAEGITLSGTALSVDDMIIGRHRNNGEGQFNGLIDEVRIYNKVVSAEEAKAIYDDKAASDTPITLTIDADAVERTIDSDSIFGINHRYAFNGYGSFDSATMQVKDDFKALYEEAGFGSIRYPGGTISNLFNWKATIGPVEERKNQIHGFYNNSGQGGIAPNFGIGEIATFADEVDSEIVYVYSLGRGNAQDAADLIEYLNAKVGTNPNGGIDWAAVRAENGHPAPYNVRYFEIGNEMNQVYSDGTSSQGYWLHGVGNAETGYIDGGLASFTRQYAVCEEDWNQTASVSDGSADMVRYMRYANTNPKMYDENGDIVDDPEFKAVEEGSVSVLVGSTEWTIVDSFENSSASDQHVVIDYSTGAVQFGDGVNGSIPASGTQIYVSYSVDRDGFIDISKAIKETTDAINKAEGTAYEANVYSSYETSGFITKMAERDANEWYDGLTIHPYSGTPSGSGESFYDSAMALAESSGIQKVQNYVNMLPVGKVPVISEYGIFRSTDTLLRSQTHAVYIAKVLMEYVRLGSPYIQKHCLIDWYSSGADSLGPTQQAVIQAVAGSDASTVTGEGTFTFFSTPSAHVFQMLNAGFGDYILASEFDSTPTMDNGAKTISALASKDNDGNVYVAIVNASREDNYSVTFDLKNVVSAETTVDVQLLSTDTIDAANTPEDPDNVTVETESFAATADNFTYTVPKHSVAVLKIASATENLVDKGSDPTDDSMDLDGSKITYSAGSEVESENSSSTEGGIELAFDGLINTYWHSAWSPTWSTSQLEDYLWVQFDISEPTVVDAIRYLPRPSGGRNGDITGYRVEGTVDGTNWVTLTEGTWTISGQKWQLARFDAIEVVGLKLIATSTYADSGNNSFASAAELRVRTGELPDPVNPFEDVYETDFYYNPVLWAVEKGVTSGKSEALFAPSDISTRADVVTFMWRAAGRPEPTSATCTFTDVSPSAYYYKAVLWAVEKGITSGTSEATFEPNAECTRAQVVSFLWRAEGRPTLTSTSHSFTDLASGAYYENAVLWAVENKITAGTSETTFEPETKCTRGQIVTFLYRYYN